MRDFSKHRSVTGNVGDAIEVCGVVLKARQLQIDQAQDNSGHVPELSASTNAGSVPKAGELDATLAGSAAPSHTVGSRMQDAPGGVVAAGARRHRVRADP